MRALQIDVITPFKEIFKQVIDSLPMVVFFFLFIIFAWLFVKIVTGVIKKILGKTKINQLSEKLSKVKIFGDTAINVDLAKLITNILKWFLIMIFLMAGSSIFGLTAVLDGLKSFFAYLPRLITAIVIFGGGVYLGTVIKNAILGMFKSLDISGGNLVANVAFYLIVIFLSITALDQAGIDTSIIKRNLTMIIGSILLAFTIAFGLGSRDAVTRLLYGYYSRKNVEIGSTIRIGDVEGVITSIDNICFTIESKEGKVIFPIKELVNNKLVVKR